MTGGRLALMAGAGILALIVVVAFFTMHAPADSERVPTQAQENVISR
jgi:hypothetical protein